MTSIQSPVLSAAVNAYREAVLAGESRSEGARRAWLTVRASEGYRHLRAPCWDEQVARNTSRRRSYRSPLGTVLAEADANLWTLAVEYGHHCTDWRRTVRSCGEADAKRAALLDALDRLAGIEPAAVAA